MFLQQTEENYLKNVVNICIHYYYFAGVINDIMSS